MPDQDQAAQAPAASVVEKAAEAWYYAEMSTRFKKVPDWNGSLMRKVRERYTEHMRTALAAAGLLADGSDRARIEQAKTLANRFLDEHAISDPASAAVLEILAALTATEEPAAASETAPTSEEQK